MNTLTASEARANLYRLIDQTVESHEPIIISGKRNSAVLLSAEDWSAIQETLHLLAVPGMRESIKAGMAEPLSTSTKAFGEASTTLRKRSSSRLRTSRAVSSATTGSNPSPTSTALPNASADSNVSRIW